MRLKTQILLIIFFLTILAIQVYCNNNIVLQPSSKSKSIDIRDTVYFDLTKAEFSNGFVDIPVFIIAFDSIHSLDFSLKYNHSKLNYHSVIPLAKYMQGVSSNYSAIDSVIRFTSYSPKIYEIIVSLVKIRFYRLNDIISRDDIFALNAYLNGEKVGTKIIGNVVLFLSYTIKNPLCNTNKNGSIELTVKGGTPPYSYLWSTGNTTQNIYSLGAEKYHITVTDKQGYNKVDSIELKNPYLILIPTNPTCRKYRDGAIKLSVNGGVPPYNYLWSNGETTNNINFLWAGIYTVTVTDSLGCEIIASQVVTDSFGIDISSINKIPTCPAFSDGSINLTVKGGYLPYKYLWANMSSLSKLEGLNAGIYSVTVTDSIGCKLSYTTILQDPPGMLVFSEKTDLSCSSVNDGKISVMVSGGTPPYNYTWSNLSTQSSIENLSQGSYHVTISDIKGCNITNSFVINNSLEMQLNFIKSDVTCYNSNNGYAQVNIERGVPPFTYHWSTGDTTRNIYNLSADIYYVTVTQKNHCSKIDSIRIINSMPAMNITTKIIYTPCKYANNGIIETFVSGGAGNYVYSWSSGQTSSISNNLCSGIYTVTVIDANNCTIADSIYLPEIEKTCLEIYSGFTPNNDGINDVWNIKNIEYYPNCIVTIYNQWGINVFSSIGYKTAWDGYYKGNILPSATYYYIIKISEKEKYTGTVSILK